MSLLASLIVASLLNHGPVLADTMAADSIIAHYVNAIGGIKALHADTTLAFSGRYEEGAFHAVTTILSRRPNLRRVSVIGPDNFAYVEIFDGTYEWEFSEAFQHAVNKDTGAAERAGRRGAEFDDPFIDYAAKGHRVESRGVTSLNGHAVNHLHVTLVDGWQKEYYFDVTTGLLVAMRKAMPLHAVGPEIESMTFYLDYRLAGGVRRPFKFVERESRSGRQMNVLEWSSIKANVPIRDEAFHPPR